MEVQELREKVNTLVEKYIATGQKLNRLHPESCLIGVISGFKIGVDPGNAWEHRTAMVLGLEPATQETHHTISLLEAGFEGWDWYLPATEDEGYLPASGDIYQIGADIAAKYQPERR